jgi:hypothetical protein
LNELPWTYLNEVAVAFNEPVIVDQFDLAVRGAAGAAYPVTNFRYEEATRTAVWTLGRPFSNDKLLLDLNADGGGVTDLVGLALDGEWSNGGGSYPSGNGLPGTDFRFRLNALPGDATRDGVVDARDWVDVRRRAGRTWSRPGPAGGPSSYTRFHDVTGDGTIDAADLLMLRRNFLRRLPAAEPAAASARPHEPATADLFATAPLIE